MTLDAFLLPGTISATAALPDTVKLSVLGATLLLLAAVEVLDSNYRVLQQAVASRAVVLERMLNIELTEDIGSRYTWTGLGGAGIQWMYAFVGASILLLGSFIFSSSIYQVVLVVGFVVWLTCSIILIRPKLAQEGGIDWTLDRFVLKKDVPGGDVVHITATNLYPPEADIYPLMARIRNWEWKHLKDFAGKKNSLRGRLKAHIQERVVVHVAIWNKGEVVWRLEEQGTLFHRFNVKSASEGTADNKESGVVYEEKAETPLVILPSTNCVWRIPVGCMNANVVYQVRPSTPGGRSGNSEMAVLPLPGKLMFGSGGEGAPPGTSA